MCVCVCLCLCLCAVAIIEVTANSARPISEQEFASVEKCKIVFSHSIEEKIKNWKEVLVLSNVTKSGENMAEYLNAGISGFGIGSNIVDKKLVENNDFEKISELAKNYTRMISK